MKRINITLTDNELKQLQEYSKQTELTISELIRRLVDKFFEELRQDETNKE